MITPTTTTAATIQTSLPSGSSSAAIPTTVRIEHAPRPVPAVIWPSTFRACTVKEGRCVTCRRGRSPCSSQATTIARTPRSCCASSPRPATSCAGSPRPRRPLAPLRDRLHARARRARRAPPRRAARRAHRPAEPRAVPRPPRQAIRRAQRAQAERVLLRRAVPRPRPLQARQRLARPPRRRPAADGRRAAGSRRRCGPATPSPASAATSSRCCSTTSATCARRRWSPSASSERCATPFELDEPRAVRRRVDRDRARRRPTRAPEEVMRDADVAMYRAKADGKGRHAVFDARCTSR